MSASNTDTGLYAQYANNETIPGVNVLAEVKYLDVEDGWDHLTIGQKAFTGQMSGAMMSTTTAPGSSGGDETSSTTTPPSQRRGLQATTTTGDDAYKSFVLPTGDSNTITWTSDDIIVRLGWKIWLSIGDASEAAKYYLRGPRSQMCIFSTEWKIDRNSLKISRLTK